MVVRATMAAWAVVEAGAPAEVWLDIRSRQGSDELEYDVIWVNKTATRLPEARSPQRSPYCLSAFLCQTSGFLQVLDLTVFSILVFKIVCRIIGLGCECC